jgi:hypothetical protein
VASLFEQAYSVIVPTTLPARRSPICQRNSLGEIDVSPVRRYASDYAGERLCRVNTPTASCDVLDRV